MRWLICLHTHGIGCSRNETQDEGKKKERKTERGREREIDREREEAKNDPVSKKAKDFLKKNVLIVPIIILCRGTSIPFTWRNQRNDEKN